MKKIAGKYSPFLPDEPIGDATITVGAEATNVIKVTIQLKDSRGSNLAVRGRVGMYLSDDAAGDSLIGTVTSGAVAIATNGVLIDNGNVAKKSFLLTSEANGLIDVNITEAGVKTLYAVVVLPNGKLKVSGAITFV